MNDDMLKLAVGEQGPQEEAGQLAKQEGILFKDVVSLQLDFQSAYPGRAGHQAGPPDVLQSTSQPQNFMQSPYKKIKLSHSKPK